MLIGQDVPQSVVQGTGIKASDGTIPGKGTKLTAKQLGQESTKGIYEHYFSSFSKSTGQLSSTKHELAKKPLFLGYTK